MNINVHAVNSEKINRVWVQDVSEILNALQKDFLFIDADSRPLPRQLCTPFGYKLDDLIEYFNNKHQTNSLFIGTFETSEGKSFVSSSSNAIASPGHLLQLRPEFSQDAMLLHLLLFAAVKMKTQNNPGSMALGDCPNKNCLFSKPSLGWPLFKQACKDCIDKLSAFQIDGYAINAAIAFIYRHGEQGFSLGAIKRNANADKNPPATDAALEKLKADIEVLAQRFSSRNVDERMIADWLRQIGDPNEMRLACRLLSEITYVTIDNFIDIFQKLIMDELPAGLEGHTVVPFGSLGDSPQIMNYVLGHLPYSVDCIRELTDTLDKIGENKKAPQIIFIDDALFLGDQFDFVLRQYYGEEVPESRKKYVDELNDDRKDILSHCQITYLCAFAATKGLERIHKLRSTNNRPDVSVKYSRLLDETSKTFHPSRCIWRNINDRNKAYSMAKRIGQDLLVSSGSSLDQAELDSLGTADMQQSIVYQYSTPKSSLTFLWKHGTYGGRAWKPLFPPLKE